MNATEQFLRARNALWSTRTDIARARTDTVWPQLNCFNWVKDYFDVIAKGNPAPALRMASDARPPVDYSFNQIYLDSVKLSNLFRRAGVGPGESVLLMLPNCVPLWLASIALMRIGAVLVPTTPLLRGAELKDRIERARVRAVITSDILVEHFEGLASNLIRISTGRVPGWTSIDDLSGESDLAWYAPTRATDPLFLYFTSGTTRLPKLVEHTHHSYPVGHLSTMYWLGLRRGDVHLNLSSPGWAKHAWSSFFAPWNAESCVVAYHYDRFQARHLMDQLAACAVSSFCAPPTVWRMLIKEELGTWPASLTELASAGEPLNPEVIERVREISGLMVRDGFGQTETTAQIGNAPGQPIVPGSMGLMLPGYQVELLDVDGKAASEGEIALPYAANPIGLMRGYQDGPSCSESLQTHYRTGDVARRDASGYFTYVGRADDLFKCSDYRISPFELESLLLEHPAVAEAAVVPSPDEKRGSVPKAFVSIAPGYTPGKTLAEEILARVATRTSPFKRVRRLQFSDLPKTISGKIRRAELRAREASRDPQVMLFNEYFES